MDDWAGASRCREARFEASAFAARQGTHIPVGGAGETPGQGEAEDPIVNPATKPGLKITAIVVENNVDPATRKDLSDRLQMTLQNTSSETLGDLEVYYKMSDSKTNASEGYYQKLSGLSIASGASQTVYFDNETGAGHYPENVYSLYRTSKNKVDITVEVSAAGYAPATADVAKDAGTGETAGE